MTSTNPAPALQRMLIRVEYDGTGLVGWQRQDNGSSVQAMLEKAAEKLTTQPTPVWGAGSPAELIRHGACRTTTYFILMQRMSKFGWGAVVGSSALKKFKHSCMHFSGTPAHHNKGSGPSKTH